MTDDDIDSEKEDFGGSNCLIFNELVFSGSRAMLAAFRL